MLERDREKGKVILIATTVIFLYYTIWVIGLPFVDDNKLQSLFYFHNVALAAPAISGLCFIGGLVIFTIYHLAPFLGKKNLNSTNAGIPPETDPSNVEDRAK